MAFGSRFKQQQQQQQPQQPYLSWIRFSGYLQEKKAAALAPSRDTPVVWA